MCEEWQQTAAEPPWYAGASRRRRTWPDRVGAVTVVVGPAGLKCAAQGGSLRHQVLFVFGAFHVAFGIAFMPVVIGPAVLK